MKNILILLVIVCILSSCAKQKANQLLFQPGKPIAELTHPDLEEVSGMVTSINNPGLLWVHNDSGDKPRFFLIDEDLKVRATYTLNGIEHRDWEDIAIGSGPDPKKNYLYIGEIGDNKAQYPLKHIYRVEEPVLDSTTFEVLLTNFDTITFRLSDKQKDTEALLIHPKSKDIYIISKRERPVYVYVLPYPYSTTDTLTASQLVSLPLTQIVAADFSSDGNALVMKSYTEIYYWENANDLPVKEWLAQPPIRIPYIREPQGESIAWKRDGSGFYTLSEKNPNKKIHLYYYARQ